MPVKLQSAQTLLGEQTRDHHQAQHHRQQQIEQIIACVDGGHTDPDAEQEKACALRGESNGPAGGEMPYLRSDAGGA